MRYEMNIGLLVNGRGNAQEIELRMLAAKAWLSRDQFEAVSFRYAKPAEGEPTLIVRLDTPRPVYHVGSLVYELAELMQQDCIAVYRPDDGDGILIGPRAQAWGNFNLDYFVRYWEDGR
jgi:hypothetical protein